MFAISRSVIADSSSSSRAAVKLRKIPDPGLGDTLMRGPEQSNRHRVVVVNAVTAAERSAARDRTLLRAEVEPVRAAELFLGVLIPVPVHMTADHGRAVPGDWWKAIETAVADNRCAVRFGVVEIGRAEEPVPTTIEASADLEVGIISITPAG